MSEFGALKERLRGAYGEFAALCEAIRPELHRYCSRMVGSSLDGEDLVQETLAQACYRLTLMSHDVALRPWLFTIAHHRCVDFLRSRSIAPIDDLADDDQPTVEIDVEIEDRNLASHAFSRLVVSLPPRERAAVVLKDVLGYSLAEIAKVLETSVGGVKSALHRGREKLALAQETPRQRDPLPPAVAGYLDAFNRADWARLQSLLTDDVHCDLVGFVHHIGRTAVADNYLATYARLSFAWKMLPGEVDGEPAILCMREEGGRWRPRHAIRVQWSGDRVAHIRDYAHCSYLLTDAEVAVVTP